MKRNIVLRIAAVVLMCTLVTACFASSTFAKYTSSATSSATVTAAAWEITANTVDVTQESSFNITTSIDDTTYVNDGYMAPGASGSFEIVLENKSDVAVDYTITLTPPTSFPPITFSTGLTYSGSLDAKGGANASKTITVTWSWPVGDTSGSDNAYAGNNYNIGVALDATQKTA